MWDGESMPADAVAGTLSFSPEEGGRLDLIGCFVPIFERMDGDIDDFQIDTIYGLTTDGEYVTLLECLPPRSRAKSSDRAFETESYPFARILTGELVTQSSEYYKCSFSFHYLKEWTDILSIDTPGDQLIPQGPAQSESLRTDEADIILDVYEDLSTVLGSNIRTAIFAIYPEESLTIDVFISDYLRPLQNLITLGIGTPVSPSFINVFSDPFGHPRSKCSFSYQASNYHEPDEIKRSDMMFTLTDIDFEESIRSWLESYETLGRLHNHYFGTLYAENMYIRLQFMSMIFALEDYHRRSFPQKQKIMEKKVFKRFRKVALERLPPIAARKRIKDLVRSIGNEPSVADRLRILLRGMRMCFPSHIILSQTWEL